MSLKYEPASKQRGPDHVRHRASSFARNDSGLVFKAHRLAYHPTLGWRVIKKKKKRVWARRQRGAKSASLVPLLFDLLLYSRYRS